jgi:hypothetical protein
MEEEEVMGSGEPRIRESQKPGVGRKSEQEGVFPEGHFIDGDRTGWRSP